VQRPWKAAYYCRIQRITVAGESTTASPERTIISNGFADIRCLGQLKPRFGYFAEPDTLSAWQDSTVRFLQFVVSHLDDPPWLWGALNLPAKLLGSIPPPKHSKRGIHAWMYAVGRGQSIATLVG
jgi:hypothetical protein